MTLPFMTRTGTERPHQIAAIGNAIVDVISRAEDSLLEKEGMIKGTMALIGADRAEALYGRMGPAIESSGGSAGNTIAGVAALGGRTAYMGRVADDQLGRVFAHDLLSLGVHFAHTPAKNGLATARCLILVTPDGQRTMNTFLGACGQFDESDVDEAVIAGSDWLYLEGYLWDAPPAKAAMRKAMAAARAAGARVAFSASDRFCIDRHRDDFLEMLNGGMIDLLFANEDEANSLFQTGGFGDAARHAREIAGSADILFALTRSEKGSMLIKGSETVEIAAQPVEAVVDTTGAGDLYAAGVMYGLAEGYDLVRAGTLGSRCAAEVIGHMGARPQSDLKRLLADLVTS